MSSFAAKEWSAAADFAELTGLEPLATHDPAVYAIIQREKARQYESLELIASENFTSRAVMECLGSALTQVRRACRASSAGGCEVVAEISRSASSARSKPTGSTLRSGASTCSLTADPPPTLLSTPLC